MSGAIAQDNATEVRNPAISSSSISENSPVFEKIVVVAGCTPNPAHQRSQKGSKRKRDGFCGEHDFLANS
jgi:hypothetical protein